MEFSELIKTATVEDVLLSRQGLPAVRGTLCITSHHLLLSSCPRGELELWLLIRNVDAVEKRVAGSSGTITLRCKDLQVLQLEIPGMEECLNIASSIEALLRSSQPLTGPNRRRCREDEQLLGTILGEGERGFVLDTRSAQAAKQARISGGGTEPRSGYPRWRRLHRALERGRPLQDSFSRLAEACAEPAVTVERWLGRLDSSRWLSHVKAALSTACLAAQCLDREGCTVLVHGAEGTDSTLLVTALAQLILDPACRTLEGFQGLLEREWIQAGHPFQVRCARSASSHARGKQEAPLFLLFLDCVWQLSRQFPFSLEFGEQLLLTLFDNAYASAYGTFLCNNERERSLCKVKESTHSLWAWLNQPEERHKYLNPLYSHNPLVIWPSVEPQSIQLWQGFFLRWIRPSQHLEEAWGEIRRLVQGNSSSLQESTGKRPSQPLPEPPAGTGDGKVGTAGTR
ncbi:myotubularin-related protein 9-like isoform X5 [Haemorhous mexicanus]|uniref:myotubularin-related protein 9-like isoform X5 n=1 Tax=Haemorhous mexicanus TaxID=30427 RepID=UPI0028BDB1A9|nr:myotubularin-related protein 9-like isoform X5 [Haemorhous mexicanus]